MIRSAVAGTLLVSALLVAIAVRVLGAPQLDLTLLVRCHGWLDTAAGPLFEMVSRVGYVQVLGPVALVLGAVVGVARRSVADALTPVVATVGASATSTLLKQVFERARPNLDPQHALSSFSMPSGHATTGAAFATAFVLLARSRGGTVVLTAALGSFALLDGLSRLVLGVHWPTDVLAGWMLGTALALLADASLRTRPAQ